MTPTAPSGPEPRLNLDTAIQGLRAIRGRHHLVSIYAEGGVVSGAAFDLDTSEGEAACKEWIAAVNRDGCNVYYHVNPLRDGFAKAKASGGDVAAVEYLVADIDPAKDLPYAEGRDRALDVGRAVWAGPCRPTVAVNSGNGAHLLFRLKAPSLDFAGCEAAGGNWRPCWAGIAFSTRPAS